MKTKPLRLGKQDRIRDTTAARKKKQAETTCREVGNRSLRSRFVDIAIVALHPNQPRPPFTFHSCSIGKKQSPKIVNLYCGSILLHTLLPHTQTSEHIYVGCRRHYSGRTCTNSLGQALRIAHTGSSAPDTIASRNILSHSPSCKCNLPATLKGSTYIHIRFRRTQLASRGMRISGRPSSDATKRVLLGYLCELMVWGDMSNLRLYQSSLVRLLSVHQPK